MFVENVEFTLSSSGYKAKLETYLTQEEVGRLTQGNVDIKICEPNLAKDTREAQHKAELKRVLGRISDTSNTRFSESLFFPDPKLEEFVIDSLINKGFNCFKRPNNHWMVTW